MQRRPALRRSPMQEFAAQYPAEVEYMRCAQIAVVVVLAVLAEEVLNPYKFSDLTQAMAVPPDRPLPEELASDLNYAFKVAHETESDWQRRYGRHGPRKHDIIRRAQQIAESAAAGDPAALRLRQRAWHQRAGRWEPSLEAKQLAASMAVHTVSAHDFLGLPVRHAMSHELEVVDGLIEPRNSEADYTMWGTYAELAAELEKRRTASRVVNSGHPTSGGEPNPSKSGPHTTA